MTPSGKEIAGYTAATVLNVCHGAIGIAALLIGVWYFQAQGYGYLMAGLLAALASTIPFVSALTGAYFVSWYFAWPYLGGLALMLAPYAIAIVLILVMPSDRPK